MPVENLEFDMVKKNIEKLRNRRYITSGTVLSLTKFFHVPKEDSYTRLVYYLTDCGLNEALWALKFFMTSIYYCLDKSTHYSWFGDVNYALMFHNYKLSEKSQPYAGVDVSWAKKGKVPRWEQWNRMTIGMFSSTLTTRSLFVWGVEVIIGDQKYKANPFNCPETNEYDPSIPRLYL